MGLLIVSFVFILAICGTAFLGVFVYKLDQTPEMLPRMRQVNRVLMGITVVALMVGMLLSLLLDPPLADWCQFIALALLALTMLFLAAQGFGIGFQQMDEDGVGFLRFFQLGSAIVFVMAFVPAFVAFITFSTRLQ
jgi:hypothetical protein